MKFIKSCLAAVAAAAVSVALPLTPALAAAPTANELARAPAIDNVVISRDGKHIAALTSPDGQTVNISIWKTDALDRKPVVLGSSHMRFLKIEFLKNDRLLVNAIQTHTMGADRGHAYKQVVTDLKGENWKPLLPEPPARSEYQALWNAHFNADVIDRLPSDPRHVLVSDERLDGNGDIYKVDVYSGAAQRIERGSSKFFAPETDLSGVVRAKTQLDYDSGNVYLAVWFRHPDTGSFDEHFRWYAKDRAPMEVVGFAKDPGIAFVLTTRPGKDKAGIYEYNIRTRQFVEPLFEHKMFDAAGIRRSTAPESYGQIQGFTYDGAAQEIYWVAPNIAALDKNLRGALGLSMTQVEWTDPGTGEQGRIPVPAGASATIIGASEDSRYLLVETSGPSRPSEFHLLTSDGKLSMLGRARPWIDPASIGETRLVQYRARDGLMIPGFLSLPPKSVFGEGPYPTIIMPHGGPWARDYLDWDVSGWPQHLTSRGYAVLKPQFRGSEGWGQKLWRAGDNEWGQKMQDDKDDGAKWLIEQKIADPGRIAMFGYSYGGYSALAAAVRPNGIYQCAISGAGAPDLAEFKKRTYENRFQREFQNPTVDGLDVLDMARSVSIPVLLYHGDRDQIVDIKQSRQFAARLKSAGKPHQLIEIEDMGHGYVTMTPPMMERQLVEIERYLKTDCGPGGL